ncbi:MULTISPECIES: MFS transporter [unclassified Paenibacillus]|uniref:MFS transporter n=1 Tax=unclassified Paenibacillus TaxID=185978 RepID=UPI0009558820|nr:MULTISPECIES: MFS transporter [unclassified Paenibacillus]ASS67543.1 MFS transporter [Paenibacillus sp. RUD330]SIQ73349.1 Sugar phosphate permease [Paenibacillus sp. RU4X]SIQ94746.1 Sugar phosphate permease [Paenibacillus sp. RU4T]
MSHAKKKIHYAWWILLGLCIMVGLGKAALNNSAGLFLKQVSTDLGVGMGSLSLYFSVSAIVTMVFLPIGGKLMAKYDTRFILSIAVILQAGAFALFGLMSSVWGWYILAVPLAVGGVFITVIAGPVLINQWFKKSKGLALGIMGAAGGLLGAFTQPAVGNLIAHQGWRHSYMIVGIAVIVIVVPIVILLLRKSPQEKKALAYGAGETTGTIGTAAAAAENKGVTLAAAKKSSAFYALIAFFFMITSAASFSMHIPTYLMNKGFDVSFAGNVMATNMIGVLIGSLVIGYASDKIGTRNTAIAAMLLGLLSIGLLLFSASSTAVISLAVGLFGLVSASIGTLGPALTSALFGNKEYSQIYSNASMGLAISSIVALPAYGYVFDYTGSYTPVLYAIGIMLIINIACIGLAFRGKKRLEQAGSWN